MTKYVRIENADMAPYKVVVEVWQVNQQTMEDGSLATLPSTLVETIELGHPTALAMPYLTSHRYLVVKEAP